MTLAEQRRHVRDLIRNVARDLIAESHTWAPHYRAESLNLLVAARFARIAARRQTQPATRPEQLPERTERELYPRG